MQTQQPAIYRDKAELYDLMYAYKDYKAEAEELIGVIKANSKSGGKKLLDVGCGTGKHLEHFAKEFDVTGTDLNPGVLKVAAKRLPNVKFYEQDITDLKINEKFDAITCLLSVIGYSGTYEGLTKAIRGLAEHLNPGGVLLIEPWFSKGDPEFRDGVPFMETYDGDIKIARISFSTIENDVSVLDTHYLVCDEKGKFYSFDEVHRIAMFDRDKTLQIMREAGLDARHDPTHDNHGRGMFIATKPL